MKKRKSFWMVLVVLLFVLAILPLAVAAASGATVVEFEGTETMLELVYEGDLSTPGDNFHGRNREWLAYEDTTNSCVTGYSHVFSNANFNKNGTENMWGKWIVEPEGYDGTWVATWHAQDDAIYASGHGTGVFTGMTVKWILDHETLEYTGTIKVPPKAQVQCLE